jgi:hypothetical protein
MAIAMLSERLRRMQLHWPRFQPLNEADGQYLVRRYDRGCAPARSATTNQSDRGIDGRVRGCA